MNQPQCIATAADGAPHTRGVQVAAERRRRHGIQADTMLATVRSHWPEYLMEAAGLGLFMVSAAIFAILIHHPDGPVQPHVSDPVLRRMLMGSAMGLTAVALIYSPMGARSGAHINPATTLTFFRLGRVGAADAIAYVFAQFAGGLAGISLAVLFLKPWIGDVHYVATRPGEWGEGAAFAGEVAITFLLMSVVLRLSNHPRYSRWTGVAVGLLVALYITVEDPISGMSMNPARSVGPALFDGSTTTLWIYCTAPPLGMLLAAELYVRQAGLAHVYCAKLHHRSGARCIFRCRWPMVVEDPRGTKNEELRTKNGTTNDEPRTGTLNDERGTGNGKRRIWNIVEQNEAFEERTR